VTTTEEMIRGQELWDATAGEPDYNGHGGVEMMGDRGTRAGHYVGDIHAEPTHPNVPWPEGISVSSVESGADLRDLAGSNGYGPPEGTPVVAGTAVIVLSRLLPLVPMGARPGVVAWARTALGGVVGTRISWAMLPMWLRTVLTGIGLSGVAIVVDEIVDLPGGLPGVDIIGGNGTDMPFAHNHVVGSWIANGVVFYRLTDGKLAVQNKKGRWKVWKPKKPIVLFANGAGNLRTMIRADKALNKQAKDIKRMLDRRGPRPRAPKKTEVLTVAPHTVQLTSGR